MRFTLGHNLHECSGSVFPFYALISVLKYFEKYYGKTEPMGRCLFGSKNGYLTSGLNTHGRGALLRVPGPDDPHRQASIYVFFIVRFRLGSVSNALNSFQ